MHKLLTIALTLISIHLIPEHLIADIKLIDDNLDLYRADKKGYSESLVYAKNMQAVSNDKLIFHCLWRVPREFSIKQATALKSIITSHKEHLANLEINLWSNVDLSENTFFKEISDFVHLRKWDYPEEAKGTLLENVDHINEHSLHDNLCYLESDLFRLLVLNKYGGFYIDMDVLVLRDMSPLNHLEFLYQWGTSGFNSNEPNILINNAIMRLNKNSDLSIECLELLKKEPLIGNSFSLGTHLFAKVNENKLLILPGVWFDSEWGFEGTENNAFKNVGNFDLFDGAYAWHWHNRWDHSIEKGSKFDLLEDKIDNIFQKIKRDYLR